MASTIRDTAGQGTPGLADRGLPELTGDPTPDRPGSEAATPRAANVVLGFAVANLALTEVVDQAWRMIKTEGRCRVFACANPHALVTASDDPEFAAALHAADLLVPDGIGVVVAGGLLGQPFPERVTGMEFFLALSQRAQAEGGLSYFFLGATEAVLRRIRERLAADFPAVRVVGTLAPGFRSVFSDDENRQMVAAINRARPDVLWVGMTAPKQEKWLHQNRDLLQVPLAGAIGAAFDFYAGTKKRAPAWMRRLGLEWLPRFLREPRRLWRRNLVSTPRFLASVLMARLNTGRVRSP